LNIVDSNSLHNHPPDYLPSMPLPFPALPVHYEFERVPGTEVFVQKIHCGPRKHKVRFAMAMGLTAFQHAKG
jgi:hypothetical protein